MWGINNRVIRKMEFTKPLTYTEAGVNSAKEAYALERMLKWIEGTFAFRSEVGSPHLKIGYFANVVNIGRGIGLAISTDGVGTKLLIAQLMHKYDTVGIDCIAINVNDILCVGAEPISVTNYIAVQNPDPYLLEEIGKGLYEGAKMAKISIPGGEISQLREMITGVRENYSFDLVGTGVGIVALNKIIIGRDIKEGDAIVGLRSTGIHSNGLTLARRIFFDKMKFKVDKYFDELGRTIGEELLEPTHIYVPEIMGMLKSGLNPKALIHITSDGFLNLKRVESDIGYIIDFLPEPHPIFPLLQGLGNVTDEEMFKVYNMGIGFCVITPDGEAEKAIEIARKYDTDAFKLGYAVEDKERKVFIRPRRLVGKGDRFYRHRC